ncbi:MAG: outer membrane protein transport protein, partial [Cytophagales bacterium]|nr:outer membrane protein transport protein [Cytophagales bacterium]
SYSNVMTDFTLTDQLKVNGTGVNANVGVIVRPVDFIRIGLGFRTPSLLWVNETSSMSLSARYAFNANAQNAPPSSASNTGNGQSFSYAVALPYHANGGISIFIKKYGFISFDAEYIDYSTTTLLRNDNSSTDFSGANNNIQSYSNNGALSFRGGAEARLDIFRLRGGFAYYAQPYQNGIDNVDRTTKIITFGFGIKQPNFYIDFAYMRPMFNSGYQIYSLSNGSNNPFVSTSNVGGSGTLTFGFNF